jgi:hypothetical protein
MSQDIETPDLPETPEISETPDLPKTSLMVGMTYEGDSNRNIVDEMETCYLDYAMSVIVSRALPDVRD